MRLDTYVNYRGNCEQAFRFYERHLGGRITGILRHREQPNPNIQADWQEKVLHARMEIGTSVLMGADVPTAEPMRSAYLTLTLDREEDAERVYALLADVLGPLHHVSYVVVQDVPGDAWGYGGHTQERRWIAPDTPASLAGSPAMAG